MRTQEVFKAISDPSRRKVLQLLQSGSKTAGQLAEAFDMTKGSMSHHFNVLKAADLVRSERRGQQIVYSLNTTVFEDVAALLLDLFKVEESERTAPMKISRANALSLGLVVLAIGMAAALYDRLPQSTPVHWNMDGQADGFMPKPWGPFLLPLVMAGVYLFLTLVARISPRGYRVERFQGAFDVIQLAVLAFLLWTTAVALLASVGAPITMNRAIHAGVGLLFVVLGNFMGKLTKNFLIGIRTPWTLASDEVWFRTHRLAGKLTLLAGAVLFVSALLGAGSVALLGAVGVAFGIPVVYSYIVYRRIEGFDKGPSDEDGSHRST